MKSQRRKAELEAEQSSPCLRRNVEAKYFVYGVDGGNAARLEKAHSNVYTVMKGHLIPRSRFKSCHTVNEDGALELYQNNVGCNRV